MLHTIAMAAIRRIYTPCWAAGLAAWQRSNLAMLKCIKLLPKYREIQHARRSLVEGPIRGFFGGEYPQSKIQCAKPYE
jgi:hypothetical protein